MKVYSILVHPERQSLNGALFDTALAHFGSKKYQVETLDLYRSEFNPWGVYNEVTADTQTDNYAHKWFAADARGLLPEFSQQEIEKIKDSDVLYIQTPIWWWGLPSIMKAYIENVFIYNVLFSLDNEASTEPNSSTVFKFLRGKKLVLSITTGSSEQFMVEHFGSVDAMLAPIIARFSFLGYNVLPVYHGLGLSHESNAEDRISNFQQYLNSTLS